MITLNDIPAIQKSLSIWEWTEWIATFFVFIGVIIDAIEMFLVDRIQHRCSHRLRKSGALFLAVGLAGELLALFQIQSLTNSLTEMLVQAIKFVTALGIMNSGGSL